MRRKTPNDYHALAEQRGLRWLGLEVSNARIRTRWECQEGHQWEAAFDAIRRGSGCPACYNEGRGQTLRKAHEDYTTLARQCGLRWVGPEVQNTASKTRWECKEGHNWEATYGNIRQGKGCPTCAIVRQAEQRRKKGCDYHALAEDRGFRWLGPEVADAHTKKLLFS